MASSSPTDSAAHSGHTHNLSSDSSCGFTGPGDYQNSNTKLRPLAYSGGPTPTMVPRPNSRLVDASAAPFCIAVDQRDFPRPVDGDDDGDAVCDIGAAEYTPAFDDAVFANGFESGDTSGWSATITEPVESGSRSDCPVGLSGRGDRSRMA